MKVRTFNLLGYNIDIYKYERSTTKSDYYMYPRFNGNAEFKVSKEGFKLLYSYIRSIVKINKLLSQALLI